MGIEKFQVADNRPFYGKFWPDGVPHNLSYDSSLTLGEMFDRAVEKYADYPAIWYLDTWVTYGKLKKMVDSFATFLVGLGIKKGDVIAIYLPNSIQYFVSYIGAAKIGAIPSGINPTYKALEVLHQVKLIGAKTLVALDKLYEVYITQITDKWQFDHVIHTGIVELASGMSPIKKFLGKKLKKIPVGKVDHPNAYKFKDVLKTPPNVPKVDIDAEKDTLTLIMTGGTTGVPKAAQLTHFNVVSNAKQCGDILLKQKGDDNPKQMGPKTAMVGVLPLYHSFAMTTVMTTSIEVGAWAMLFPSPPPTEQLLKTIYKMPNYNGYIYCAAEILFQRIAELDQTIIDKYPMKGRLRLSISGAGPLHDYVRKPFESKTGAKITEGYGLSEASPVVSANNFFGIREEGYIGVPAPSTDWAIFDQEDFSKGPLEGYGEEFTGEICVCGPQVMVGYWNQPERTAETIREYNGRKWLLTGDIGYMDEHGRMKIRDRKKQLIKMAGHSVFPAEVESLLGEHPKVLEVAVAGLPDMKTGEAVKAWVALHPNAKGSITSEELLAWAKENMTHWKCPKYIEIIDEIPKTMVGKVMRRTLQEADPMYKKE